MTMTPNETTRAVALELQKVTNNLLIELLGISRRKYKKLNSRRLKKLMDGNKRRKKARAAELEARLAKIRKDREKGLEDISKRKALDIFRVELDVKGDPEQRSFEVTATFPDSNE